MDSTSCRSGSRVRISPNENDKVTIASKFSSIDMGKHHDGLGGKTFPDTIKHT